MVALFGYVLDDVVVVDKHHLPPARCGIMADVVDAELDKNGNVAEVWVVPIDPQLVREPIVCLLRSAEDHRSYQKHKNKQFHYSFS